MTLAKATTRESGNSAKDAIKSYLDARAVSDPQFATVYAKPNKSIDECFRYILGEARKRGTSVCMTDEEVFGLAVHYYDEDNIKVSSAPANFRASVSRKPVSEVELTEDEKASTREAAMKCFEEECLAGERKRAKTRKGEKAQPAGTPKRQPSPFFTPSLFD